MDALDIALQVVFWGSSAAVVYTYLVYPLLIWTFSRHVAPPAPVSSGDADTLPTASLLLAAYNEEDVVEDRLHNALAMGYPPGRLEILVGSDGSRDRTAEIVARFADRGVRLFDFAENRGKATVLNSLAAEAQGEILLMSDANTHIDPAAARLLVRWFSDPRIGSVVGRLVLVDRVTGCNADALYWNYETFLKRCEGRLGALLGANGAIYAIRKALYTPIPAVTIVDDFVIPLLAKVRTGCSIVYDPSAVATEETAPDVGSEFHRRARIGAGGFQSICMLWRLLDPRHGWVAFAFFSHKILRWICPFFMIGALVSSLWLLRHPFYRLGFLVQVVFYLTSLVMPFVPYQSRALRPLRLTTMFTGMNAALLVGFWRWLRGRQKAAWRKTERIGKPERIV